MTAVMDNRPVAQDIDLQAIAAQRASRIVGALATNESRSGENVTRIVVMMDFTEDDHLFARTLEDLLPDVQVEVRARKEMADCTVSHNDVVVIDVSVGVKGEQWLETDVARYLDSARYVAAFTQPDQVEPKDLHGALSSDSPSQSSDADLLRFAIADIGGYLGDAPDTTHIIVFEGSGKQEPITTEIIEKLRTHKVFPMTQQQGSYIAGKKTDVAIYVHADAEHARELALREQQNAGLALVINPHTFEVNSVQLPKKSFVRRLFANAEPKETSTGMRGGPNGAGCAACPVKCCVRNREKAVAGTVEERIAALHARPRNGIAETQSRSVSAPTTGASPSIS